MTSDAYVVRSVDYGDHDRIVTLLTREYGKVSAMARIGEDSEVQYSGYRKRTFERKHFLRKTSAICPQALTITNFGA